MSKISEKQGVEVPVCEWLGKLGWTPARTPAYATDDPQSAFLGTFAGDLSGCSEGSTVA